MTKWNSFPGRHAETSCSVPETEVTVWEPLRNARKTNSFHRVLCPPARPNMRTQRQCKVAYSVEIGSFITSQQKSNLSHLVKRPANIQFCLRGWWHGRCPWCGRKNFQDWGVRKRKLRLVESGQIAQKQDVAKQSFEAARKCTGLEWISQARQSFLLVAVFATDWQVGCRKYWVAHGDFGWKWLQLVEVWKHGSRPLPGTESKDGCLLDRDCQMGDTEPV